MLGLVKIYVLRFAVKQTAQRALTGKNLKFYCIYIPCHLTISPTPELHVLYLKSKEILSEASTGIARRGLYQYVTRTQFSVLANTQLLTKTHLKTILLYFTTEPHNEMCTHVHLNSVLLP